MNDKIAANSGIPFEVQKGMVDSLFGSIGTVIFGLVAHSTVLVVCWSATNNPLYFFGIPYFALVVAYRLAIYFRFKATWNRINDAKTLARWENLYMVGGFLVAGGVGIVAAYAVLSAPDTVAPALGMGIVGGSMISVVGRNFGSVRNAKIMTYSCCAPLVIGFLVGGILQKDHLIALASIPLFVVMTTSVGMSKHLNGLLLGALRAVRKSEIDSQKFNVAISSMPNGLMMVDGDQKIVVSNDRASEILGVENMKGLLLSDILRAQFNDIDPIFRVISLPDNQQDDFDLMTFEARDGRHLRFRARHLDDSETRFMDEEWGGKQDGAFVLTVLDVTRKVASDEEIKYLARFDGLTQIANRTHWETTSPRLVAELPPGGLVGLAVLDVDRFKLINDTLGHHIGDEVIAGVARRLGSVGDPRMFSGRLGGDEFVVLIPGIRDIDEARALYDRVFAAICTTYVIGSHNVEVRCSGGVVVREREAFNLHADMSRADMALYKVKRDPNRSWLLFDDHLENEYETSIRIKHDLRDAIENQRLDVVYQPIYDARGDRLVSAEALSRWKHPEVGHIPPSRFIAMAEEIGLIGKLTRYVLHAACRDCMTWNPGVTVSVNLSAIDLARDGIVDMISEALAANGMPPARLCIEVTESVFVKDFEKTAATLLRLREMGVKTSLDDFGTGYSSLSYMHRLPLNRVKIDRSFVIDIQTDEKTRQLFGAVVGLAKSLGFEVVVEGVEDRKQLETVLAVPGVDMIQGHVFSEDLTNPEMIQVADAMRPDWRGAKVIRLL